MLVSENVVIFTSNCQLDISKVINKRKFAGNHAKFRQQGNIPFYNLKLFPASEGALKRKGDAMR